MKAEGRSQLDLMIVDNDENLVAYSLKCDKISKSDFKDPLKQALGYANHYNMNVHLVNFFYSGHKSPSEPEDVAEEITLINVEHNKECTRFTITLPSDPDYSRVVNVKLLKYHAKSVSE